MESIKEDVCLTSSSTSLNGSTGAMIKAFSAMCMIRPSFGKLSNVHHRSKFPLRTNLGRLGLPTTTGKTTPEFKFGCVRKQRTGPGTLAAAKHWITWTLRSHCTTAKRVTTMRSTQSSIGCTKSTSRRQRSKSAIRTRSTSSPHERTSCEASNPPPPRRIGPRSAGECTHCVFPGLLGDVMRKSPFLAADSPMTYLTCITANLIGFSQIITHD